MKKWWIVFLIILASGMLGAVRPAGKTGWTNYNPHLHFQRRGPGGWITNSQPVYFNEYPGQQLQEGQWYQSQNYWAGDNCPTSVEAGLGSGGSFSLLSILGTLGAGVGKMIRRRGGVRVFIRGMMGALLMAGLLSGCGPLGEVTRGSEEVPPLGTPAGAFGPEQPAGVVTPSPTPTAAEPPSPPTPGPVPTPRPLIFPSAEEVEKLTAHWKVFEDPELGIRFRYPPDYEIRIQPMSHQRVGISIDRPMRDPHWGEVREIFDGMLVFLLEREDPRLSTPEGLEAWVRELPEGESPIPGGGPIRVVEKIQVGGRPAFVIQEPLWPGDPPKVQSLIVIGKKRVLWIGLGDTMYLNPERTEKLWPQQMAFLATLKVTR